MSGRRPNPPDTREVKLAWEVDPSFYAAREAFMRRTPEELRIYLRAHLDIHDGVTAHPHWKEASCFHLMRLDVGRPALIETIRKARAKIAIEIGVTPAAFHDFLPEYDKEFLREYRYSYTVMCRLFGRHCIRPSHLQLCRLEGGFTRYPLVTPNREVS